MKNLVAIIFMISVSGGAMAATQVTNTKIKELYLAKKHGEFVFVRLEKSAPRSECSVNGTWDYTLSLNSEFGKAMYSTVLSAYAAGKTVTVVGDENGLCNEFGFVESMDSIRLL